MPPDDTTRRLLHLYVPSFVISFGQGMVLPAVPALATHFRVSPGTAAQVVTAQAAGAMAALLPVGALVDRFGAGTALRLGSAAIAAGAAAMLAPAFWAVLCGQFLVGVGASLWTAGREIGGLALVRPDQRGRLMSGFFGFQLAGTAAGPVAGGLLVQAGGLRALFLAYAALAAGVLIATALVRMPGDRTVRVSTPSPGGVNLIAPAYRRTFAVIVFATFAMSLYRSTVNSLLPVYASTRAGLSSAQIGALFGVLSVGIMAMIVPAGLILDRVGRKWAAVPGAALPALAFAVLPLARSPLALSALAAALGLSNGLALGSMSTFSYDVIPEHARGRLQALRRLIGDGGALVGPLLGGVLADRRGAGAPFAAYAPLLAVTALLLAFGTRETLARRPEATPARPPGRRPAR